MAQHAVGNHAVTAASLYGSAAGPTFPDAAERTSNLLEMFTQELVFGRTGMRVICGDFNHSVEALPNVDLWLQQGWIEVQSWP